MVKIRITVLLMPLWATNAVFMGVCGWWKMLGTSPFLTLFEWFLAWQMAKVGTKSGIKIVAWQVPFCIFPIYRIYIIKSHLPLLLNATFTYLATML